MSLSTLPCELLLQICSYLTHPVPPSKNCTAPYRPFPILRHLYTLSLTCRRLAIVVGSILHQQAVSEARQLFFPRDDPRVLNCITHFPTSLALVIRSGNVRLAQELVSHLPEDAFPPQPPVEFPFNDATRMEEFSNRVSADETYCTLCASHSWSALLHSAIERRRVEMVRWMLDNQSLFGGATPHPIEAVVAAVRSRSIEMMELVWSRCDERWRARCALREAVLQNDAEMVLWILEMLQGTDETVEVRNTPIKGNIYCSLRITVFEYACRNCNPKIAELLIKYDTASRERNEERLYTPTGAVRDEWIVELARPDDPGGPRKEMMLVMWDRAEKGWYYDDGNPVRGLAANNASLPLLASVLGMAPAAIRGRCIRWLLNEAVMRDNVELARLIFDKFKEVEFDVNELDILEYYDKPQNLLCWADSTEMVKLMMDAGADPFLQSQRKVRPRSPLDRFLTKPTFLRIILPYITDRSHPNGRLNSLLRQYSKSPGGKSYSLWSIDKCLEISGEVLLDAGVAMDGLEEYVARYKKRCAEKGEEEKRINEREIEGWRCFSGWVGEEES